MTKIACIIADKSNISRFAIHEVEQYLKYGMLLSDQIGAHNLRIRESEPGYSANWHIAGDPTLIIIQNGRLRITLQSGEYNDFVAGEMFIAADRLPDQVVFDSQLHGHKAEVIGDEPLRAVHIKLAGWMMNISSNTD